MKATASVCIFALGAITFQFAAAASIPMVDVDPAADGWLTESHSNGGTWGWTFYVTTPIVVTHVGWYDEGGNGLSHSHRIGLWKDQTGTTQWPYIGANSTQLLGKFLPDFDGIGATVPAGTVAELDGPWRKIAIPDGPITLQPGGYALGGIDSLDSTDSIRYTGMGENELIADGRAIVGAPGFSTQAGFNPPGIFYLVWGIESGPMLFVQPVPEPSTLIIAFMSVVGIACGRRGRWGSRSTSYFLVGGP